MNGVTKNDQKEIFYPMDDFKFEKSGLKQSKINKKEKSSIFDYKKKMFLKFMKIETFLQIFCCFEYF